MSNFTKITFEDHGQDFLTWTIDKRGIIIDCQPFQFSIWKKWIVINSDFKVGGFVEIKKGFFGDKIETMTIKYPIQKIEKL